MSQKVKEGSGNGCRFYKNQNCEGCPREGFCNVEPYLKAAVEGRLLLINDDEGYRYVIAEHSLGKAA